MPDPLRGEVWNINLNPTKGREQKGIRPALVVSDDRFNKSGAELAIIVPITSKQKNIPYRVPVDPPEGGLDTRSYVMCDQIRTIDKIRFIDKRGSISDDTLSAVEDRIRILLSI